eukprot:236577-Prorocentrum_lima.AAC.1
MCIRDRPHQWCRVRLRLRPQRRLPRRCRLLRSQAALPAAMLRPSGLQWPRLALAFPSLRATISAMAV